MALITYGHLVIDALVAAQRAVPGYRAPTGTTSGIPVYDGPEALLTGDKGTSFLIIGYGNEDTFDPGDPGSDSFDTEVSVRAIASTSPKEELGEIACLASYTTGDMNVSAARLAVATIASSVDSTLRADPKLGIASTSTGQLLWCQVTRPVSFRTYLSGEQLCAEMRFTLTYKART